MPLNSGELVGLACMRDLIEDQVRDLGYLRDELFNDEADEDYSEVSTAAFYYALATDYIDKILMRHDKPRRSTSKALVLYDSKKDKDLSDVPTGTKSEKKITDMTPKEIGDGTVLFDPKGEAWIAELWTDTILDLKQGNVKKANVKPKDLEGWTFDGVSFDERITVQVKELAESMDNPSAGKIAAEIAIGERSINHPLSIIKQVNKVLEAA